MDKNDFKNDNEKERAKQFNKLFAEYIKNAEKLKYK